MLLSECLSSIYDEAGSENFEVIFVDDGSMLDYSDILKGYPIIYERIKNRGHLGARLHGISVANGDYIGFVDSDDSVSKNYHAPMLDLAKKSGADIVLNGWAFHTDRTKRICTRDTTMCTEIDVSGDDCLPTFTAQRGREHSYYVLWNKIYEKKLLKKAANELSRLVSSGERITYGEDALFNFFCFKYAKIVKNVNTGLYFYRIHSAQSVIAETEEKLLHQIKCMSSVFRIMKENVGEGNHAEVISQDLAAWRALISRTHYSKAKAQKLRELYPIIKEAYEVHSLEMPKAQDGEVYNTSELLGDNFADVDAALTELYYCEKPISIQYEKKCVYVSRTVKYASKVCGGIIYSKKASLTVPKRKIKLRDRIIHSPIIYRIGLLLFKKGSRLRSFLKKHL